MRDHVLAASWRRRPRGSRCGANRGLPGNWRHTGSWDGGADGIHDRSRASFPFTPCSHPQAAVESDAQEKRSADPLSGFLAWCGQAGVELSPKVRHSGPARARLRSALVSSFRPSPPPLAPGPAEQGGRGGGVRDAGRRGAGGGRGALHYPSHGAAVPAHHLHPRTLAGR